MHRRSKGGNNGGSGDDYGNSHSKAGNKTFHDGGKIVVGIHEVFEPLKHRIDDGVKHLADSFLDLAPSNSILEAEIGESLGGAAVVFPKLFNEIRYTIGGKPCLIQLDTGSTQHLGVPHQGSAHEIKSSFHRHAGCLVGFGKIQKERRQLHHFVFIELVRHGHLGHERKELMICIVGDILHRGSVFSHLVGCFAKGQLGDGHSPALGMSGVQ